MQDKFVVKEVVSKTVSIELVEGSEARGRAGETSLSRRGVSFFDEDGS